MNISIMNIWLLHTSSIYKTSTRSHAVLVVFVVKP